MFMGMFPQNGNISLGYSMGVLGNESRRVTRGGFRTYERRVGKRGIYDTHIKGCTHRAMILCNGTVDSHREE